MPPSPRCLSAVLSLCLVTSLVSADIRVGGQRPVTVRIPESYDPEVPTPLLLMLHGFSALAAMSETQMRFAPLCEARGVLYAHPEGIRNQSGLTFWNATSGCCNLDGSEVDDSGYLRALIEEIQAELSVDERQIYLAGYSNGGFMSHRMACDHADLIAGIASYAGSTHLDEELCQPSDPVHILQIHGTSDGAIFYQGGTWGGLARHPGARETVERWAAFNGCSLEPDDSLAPIDLFPSNRTDVSRYAANCAPGGSAELWTVVGGSHGLPLSTTIADGVPTTRWALRSLDWLLAHPKRPVPRATITFTDNGAEGVLLDAGGSSTPAGTEIVAYEWDFGDGERAEGLSVAHRYARAGMYTVRLSIRTTDENRRAQASLQVTSSCPSEDLAPWSGVDVGTPPFRGGALRDERLAEAALSGDAFEVCAGGRDLSARDDEFFFIHEERAGDLVLTALLSDYEGGTTTSKAGVMLRAGLEPDAAYVSMLVQSRDSGPQFRFRRRSEAGGSARNTSGERLEEGTPAWVRLERRGAMFRGLASTDGETWTLVDELELPDLPERLLGGLAATGRDPRENFDPFRLRVAGLRFDEAEPEVRFLRGDCTDDGRVDISDAVCSLTHLFLDDTVPSCEAALSIRGFGQVTIADPIALLNFLFLGAAPPAAPFPDCGPFEGGELDCLGTPAACQGL